MLYPTTPMFLFPAGFRVWVAAPQHATVKKGFVTDPLGDPLKRVSPLTT
jgi:hypothetical protein